MGAVLRFWIWLGMVWAVPGAWAQPPSGAGPEALEGYWLGTVQMDQQSYDLGLEFRREPSGRLVGRQWFAVLHLMGSSLGELTEAEGHVRAASFGLDLVLGRDELTGTINGHDPLRLRRSEALPAPPPTPDYPSGPASAWTCRLGAPVWATPAVAGGRVGLGDAAGKLHMVDARTGRLLWVQDTGAPIYGDVWLTAETADVLNDAGWLYRFDAATGRECWRRELGGGQVVRRPPSSTEFSYDYRGGTPVLAEGVLYVAAADGSVWALTAATGEVRWRVSVGGRLRNRVLVAGDRVVVANWDGRVLALHRDTGAQLWQIETREAATADPVACGDGVLVSSRNSRLYRLRLADGATVWTYYHAGSWVESAPLVADGVAFVGSSDLRVVRAFDPATGATQWSTDVLGWSWGTPVLVGNMVYAGTAGAVGYPIAQTGGLVALDRRTGAARWRVVFPAVAGGYVAGVAGSPAAADGLIFCAGQDGVLYAFPTEADH